MAFFNKKGQDGFDWEVAAWIFGIAVLVLLLTSIFIFKERGGPVFSDTLCRWSVYLSDQTLGITEKFFGNLFLCETKHIVMEENGKEKALEDVANKMRTCWWMWGQGEWDPSPNILKWNQNKCFSCYRLEATSSTPDITLTELTNYLKDTEIKKEKMSYWNYLRGENRNAIVFNFPSAESDNEKLFKPGSGNLNDGFYDITYINNVKTSLIGTFIEGSISGTTLGAVGCSVTGAGALLCGGAGFIVGGTVVSSAKIIIDYFRGDFDAIMVSESKVTENICDAVIT